MRLAEISARAATPVMTRAASVIGLGACNLVMRVKGFRAVHDIVRRWPVFSWGPFRTITPEGLCAAVDWATVVYPEKSWCLSRSAVSTCLLRTLGIRATMVVGVRPRPFSSHAWVEVEGRVVNDEQIVGERYSPIERI
jgi:hypothetical protein